MAGNGSDNRTSLEQCQSANEAIRPRTQSPETEGAAGTQAAIEEETTHSFMFWLKKTRYTASCSTANTVLEALNFAPDFKFHFDENSTKDIIIKRKPVSEGPVTTYCVSPHFPARLIDKKEILQIQFIEPDGDQCSYPENKESLLQECFILHISTKTGKDIVYKVMKNKEFHKTNYASVYGFKGDTIRDALRRDGRFEEVILTDDHALINVNTQSKMYLHYPVREFHNVTLKIIRNKRGQVGECDEDGSKDQGLSYASTSVKSENDGPSETSPTAEQESHQKSSQKNRDNTILSTGLDNDSNDIILGDVKSKVVSD